MARMRWPFLFVCDVGRRAFHFELWLLGVQDRTNFARKSGQRKWLGQKSEIGVVAAVVNDSVRGFPGMS